jgi:hypothetical protein
MMLERQCVFLAGKSFPYANLSIVLYAKNSCANHALLTENRVIRMDMFAKAVWES